jgi:hypothetical protein
MDNHSNIQVRANKQFQKQSSRKRKQIGILIGMAYFGQ